MTTSKSTTLRRCAGSERFGIEPHEAPISEFTAQPSRKDGLAAMCKPHWSAYVKGLAADRKARQASTPTDVAPIEAAMEAGVDAAFVREFVREATASKPTKGRPTTERRAANRKPRAAKPAANAHAVADAQAVIAELETLSGEAYTQRLGEDEVQRALETVAAASGHRDRETPLGETIDAGAEEADAA